MASAKTAKFGAIAIEIEVTPDANDWTKPCGVRTKGFNRTNNLSETEVPDCDDEDLPSDIERDILSRTVETTFAGTLDKEQMDLWDDWWDDGATRRVRVTIPGAANEGGRKYIVPCKLATYNLGAERGQKWTFEASLQSDGRLVRTNASA